MDHIICVDKVKVVLGGVQQLNTQTIIVVFGFRHSADFNRHLEYFMFKVDQDL